MFINNHQPSQKTLSRIENVYIFTEGKQERQTIILLRFTVDNKELTQCVYRMLYYIKKMSLDMKHWKTCFYGLGTIPLLFCISLLIFYFHTGLILGRLPKCNQPDPKQLGIYSDYMPIIDLTGNLWLYSLIIWLLLIVYYFIARRKQIIWKPIIISALGQVCAISLFLSGIMEWYAD